MSHSREGGRADAAGVVRPAPRQAPAGAQRRRALSPVSGSGCDARKQTKTNKNKVDCHVFTPSRHQDDAAEAGGEAGGRRVRAALPPQQAGSVCALLPLCHS